MSSKAKSILTKFLQEVWNDGDVTAAVKYIAPQYTVHHDPDDPWDGKVLTLAAYEQRVTMSRAPFPDQRFDIQGLYEDGGAVVVTWLWSGTHKADIPGFPATGRRITMSGATVYFFDGDKLTGHWQITDRLGVYQQLRQATDGR